MYPVFFNGFSIGNGGVNMMALIGGVTILIGAMLAFVQDDIKKVLAYSTISQLGYMVMALGVGAWGAAVFHLFTHAFFKALLFLGAGSVSHAGTHHSFDMKEEMGGLRKPMPITFWTFMIGTLALAGIFPLAGFWSKDEILATASQSDYKVVHGDRPHRRRSHRGVHDPLRLPHLLRRVPRPPPPARVRADDHVPLIILAVLSVVAGFLKRRRSTSRSSPSGSIRSGRSRSSSIPTSTTCSRRRR